ncbi:MAG: hypothetical protein JSU66_04975 [Deltaproteobacteria bacterium]|nr:MAG: hypothetical protein JSU66_04975 [Deltaproteobacteria bacterium]
MEPEALLARLVELAGEVGLPVRRVRGSAVEDGTPARSAVCRVYGSRWVLLAASDPADARIAVLAEALVEHAPRLLDERFLEPAVRERLEAQRAPRA